MGGGCAAHLPYSLEVSAVYCCAGLFQNSGRGRPRALSRQVVFQQSIADLGGGTLNGILCVSLIMFVMLIPFFVATELQRVLGDGKLMQLFFRPRNSFQLPKDQSLGVVLSFPTPLHHSIVLECRV